MRQTVVHVGLLVAVCCALFLLGAGSLPLTDPDESRCALIVRDMIADGDWVVPRLDGEAYFDKPALFFWLAAAGRMLTDSPELGGRMVAALSAIGAVLVTFSFARRLWGGSAGLLAGVILATSAQFLFMARWYRMDMPFAAAMWAGIWWVRRCETRRPGGSARRRKAITWMGFYGFAALSTLFKGPAGLVIPILVIGSYFFLSRQYKRLGEFFNPLGLTVFLLIAAPWYLLVALREPGYAYEFFIRQNFLRYAGGGGLRHDWPGILYVPILLGGLLPWTIYLPGAFIRFFPRRWRLRAEHPDILLLWLAALAPLLFFAFGSTKMAGYILPVFPPLAILMAGLIVRWVRSDRPDRLLRAGARAMLVSVLVFPFGLAGAEIWLGDAGLWLAAPFCLAGVSFLGMTLSLRHGRRRRFLAWATAALVGMLVYVIAHTAPVACKGMSTRTLARLVPAPVSADTHVCFWEKEKYSFILYTGARQTTDFDRSDPEALNRLSELLASGDRVYCLVSGLDQLESLKKACRGRVPVVVLGQSGDRWVVTNRVQPAGEEKPRQP